jgi:hypothetical protein
MNLKLTSKELSIALGNVLSLKKDGHHTASHSELK